MPWRKFIFALGGVILAAQPACATVSVVPAQGTVKGSVFLNRGKGFESIVASTEGHPGDSVMASRGGLASIVYPDGCKIEVSSTTAVVFVQDTSPCKGPAVTGPGRLGVGTYVVGAAIAGGAVVAVALMGGGSAHSGPTKSGGGNPASP